MRTLLGLLMCLALHAEAAEFRPFTAASRQSIEREYAGRPFVLVFWSVDCTYCADELRHLRQLAQDQPQISLVLVSTDSADLAAEAGAMLDKLFRGIRTERWIFSGGDAEHLYFAVDRKWRGELPRAYFYDAAGTARTVAGKVGQSWIEAWIRTLGPGSR